MDTSQSLQDEELADTAASVSVESHTELAMQGDKVDVTEGKHESHGSQAKILVENLDCQEAGHEKNVFICPQGVRLKNEKNRTEKVLNDLVILDQCNNDNNNSMEFTENIGNCGEEYSSKCLVGNEIEQQKAGGEHQPNSMENISSLDDQTPPAHDFMKDKNMAASSSAGRDVSGQELVQGESAASWECHLITEHVVSSVGQSQPGVDQNWVKIVDRKTVNRNLTCKTNESHVNDSSSLLEHQPEVTKLERNPVSPSGTCTDELKEDIARNKDEQTMESCAGTNHTVVHVEEQDQKVELQPDQQPYSLHSISDELTNVKNTLSEEALLKSKEDEKNGDSSDIEESSGTTTTSTESDDEASSSSDDEELDTRAVVVVEEEDEDRIHQAPPKTRDEVLVVDLPAEPELNITIDEQTRIVEIGQVTSAVETLMVVQAKPQTPALDIDTILFLEDRTVLGKVFEVFGPVQSPYYSIRFNSEAEIKEKHVEHGTKVFYGPDLTDLTKFVFTAQLRQMRGSDASWKFDQEPPVELIEYSDDEEESKAKAKKRHGKRGHKATDNGCSDRIEKGRGSPKQSRGNRAFGDDGHGSHGPRGDLTSQPRQHVALPHHHAPHYSGGFGPPPPRPGQYSQGDTGGATFQPGAFSGPPRGAHVQKSHEILPRGQFMPPRPMPTRVPRGPPPGFPPMDPRFMVPPERPFGTFFTVPATAPQQPPQPFRTSLRGSNPGGPPPNSGLLWAPNPGGPPPRTELLRGPILSGPPPSVRRQGTFTNLQGSFPERFFPRPYEASQESPSMAPQGAFKGGPSARSHNLMSIGVPAEERAALYMPPPPPPSNLPFPSPF